MALEIVFLRYELDEPRDIVRDITKLSHMRIAGDSRLITLLAYRGSQIIGSAPALFTRDPVA